MKTIVNLPKHSHELLRILSSDTGPFSIGTLMSLSKTSRRMVYYNLDNIKTFLYANNLGELSSVNEGYSLTAEQRKKTNLLLDDQYVFDSKEVRVGYIICYLMWARKIVRLADFMNEMEVSRNAILSDLQEVKDELRSYQLELDNNKKDGFFITGDNFRKRTVYLYYIRKLLQTGCNKSIDFIDPNQMKDYSKKIRIIFEELKITIDENEILATTCLLVCIQNSPTLYRFNIADMNYICTSPILALVDKNFPFLTYHERIYLTIHLLGYTGQRNLSDGTVGDNMNLLDLSAEIVKLFENISCISFNNEQELIHSIYLHIQLSYYNYFHLIPNINPLQEDIKERYSDIYKITESCCNQLRDKFPYPFFDSEITYLTMHFGSYMRNAQTRRSHANILIVCPNLTTSAILLKNEIANSFKYINIVGLVKPSEVNDASTRGIDFIVSAISFPSKIPLILVHSVMTAEDRANIASFVMMLNIGTKSDANQLQVLLDIVRRNVDKNIYKSILSEMNNYMNRGGSFITLPVDDRVDMVSMLEKYGIYFDLQSDTLWEQAIRNTSRSLLLQNVITQNYVTVMIDLVHTYGPYIVINQDIAIAHAQPTDGANQLGLAMSIFPNGLKIGNHTVRILFVLSAIDQSAHLRIMKDIISLNENSKIMEKMIKSKSALEALDIIKTVKTDENM